MFITQDKAEQENEVENAVKERQSRELVSYAGKWCREGSKRVKQLYFYTPLPYPYLYIVYLDYIQMFLE